MNLHHLLKARAQEAHPIRVGLIGAGKFGSMFLAQVRRTPGLHLVAIADLSLPRIRAALARTGWPQEQLAPSFEEAARRGATYLTEDALALIHSDAVEVVIDATGSPQAAIRHTLVCCEYGKHMVSVTVEADALAGPMLARRAQAAGVVYSLAYGDQPALICEMVDWARACGFEVIAAGKGTKYLPRYHQSTPATVWDDYGFTPAEIATGEFNAQMFNSFLDGTKPAIEMAAVSNATGLLPPRDGLAFPPGGVDDLARVLRPRSVGGDLEGSGMVEVLASLHRDGRPVERDLRWGVFVSFRAPDGYVADCFRQYGLVTDGTGEYSALYRPYHLIGLELGISVASVALRGEPTGCPTDFHADVVATAKRDLQVGEQLDGEGGYLVWGKLVPTAVSLAQRALPIGLAHGPRIIRPVSAGTILKWDDVEPLAENDAMRLRREMEDLYQTTG